MLQDPGLVGLGLAVMQPEGVVVISAPEIVEDGM